MYRFILCEVKKKEKFFHATITVNYSKKLQVKSFEIESVKKDLNISKVFNFSVFILIIIWDMDQKTF